MGDNDIDNCSIWTMYNRNQFTRTAQKEMVAMYSSAEEVVSSSLPIDMDIVIRKLETDPLITVTVLRRLHEQRMGRQQ